MKNFSTARSQDASIGGAVQLTTRRRAANLKAKRPRGGERMQEQFSLPDRSAEVMVPERMHPRSGVVQLTTWSAVQLTP